MTSTWRFPHTEAPFPEIFDEDEAWTQLERGMDSSEAPDTTELGMATVLLSHTTPAATAHGSPNSTFDTIYDSSKGGIGLVHPEALIPLISAETQPHAASERLNALSSRRAFGQDMVECNPLIQSVINPVFRYETEHFDSNAPYGQNSVAGSNVFEDMDFHELMSHLIVSPDEDKGDALPAGESSLDTCDKCPIGLTKTANVQVGGNGLALQATDLERPTKHQTFQVQSPAALIGYSVDPI
jgi:hypothetical protein